MKRILVLVIALAMLIGTVALPISAEESTGETAVPTEVTAEDETVLEAEDDEEPEIAPIEYSVDNDESVKFKAADFESVCLDVTGENLSYILITIPPTAYGSLWYDYDGNDEAKVTASTKYYKSSTSSKNLSYISYVPKYSFAGKAEIEYKAYTTANKYYVGTIEITVTASENAGDLDKITYYMDPGDRLKLDSADINTVCRNSGFSLSYAKFKIPSTAYGALYYNYKSSSTSNTKVKDTYKYYKSSSSSSTYLIDNITFVTAEDNTDDIELTYLAYDSDDIEYKGIIRIKFDNSNYDIAYTVEGENVEFVASDFNGKCVEETGAKLDYVKFSLPSKGTLYYDYDNENSDRATVKSTNKYYYKKSPYLYLVSYVPKVDYTGTISIDYTGYNVDGESYNGTVTIKVKNSSLEEADDIKYSIKNTSYKTMDSTTLNNACKDATGANLDYVKFTSTSSGNLYYKYSSSSEEYDSKVLSTNKYYRNVADYIKYVSYVPKSGYSGTATIAYTGYSEDGDGFTGKIKITVTSTSSTSSSTSSTSSGEDITYSITSDETALFVGSDFNSMCKEELEDTLDYVKFSTPSSGTLYYDYEGDKEKEIKSTYQCYYKNDEPLISDICFVPEKNYKGTVSIKYSGYSTEEEKFTGYVKIKVTRSESEVKGMENFVFGASYKKDMFADVNEDEWYGANQNGVIKKAFRYGLMKGKSDNAFDPSGNMTIAEAITIAARIADIYYGEETKFKSGDVWYEPYVEYAVSKDIIDEDDFSDYNANITREQMAYIFANILPEDEMDEINEVEAIPDVDKYDEYYNEILYLYNTGVLSGSDSVGTFYPKQYITRAESSAIIVRIADPEERKTNKF